MRLLTSFPRPVSVDLLNGRWTGRRGSSAADAAWLPPSHRSGAFMRRCLSLVAVLVAVGVFALPTASFGSATVGQDSVTEEFGPFPVDDTCAGPGVVGLLTLTETRSRRTVETNTGFHVTGTITDVYRVDFADGSYLLAAQREPVTFTDQSPGLVTFGGTLLEKGTLYDANGVVIGHEMFHSRFRRTIVNGTITVDFDEGFLTCR